MQPTIEQIGDVLTVTADLSYCSICACMQTQHKLQLDARDEGRYVPPIYQSPDVQSMTRGYPADGAYQGNAYSTAVPPQGYPAMRR